MLDEQWKLDFRAREEEKTRKWQEKQSACRWEVLVAGGVVVILIVASQVVSAFIARG